jgi:hypothetical protein
MSLLPDFQDQYGGPRAVRFPDYETDTLVADVDASGFRLKRNRGDAVNILDWGGDLGVGGSAAANDAALSAAIQEAIDNGSRQVIIPGRINFVTPIELEETPIWFSGNGADASRSDTGKLVYGGTPGATMFTALNCEHGGIRDIIFDGNSLAAACCLLDGVCNSRIIGNRFQGFTTLYGLKLMATGHAMAWNQLDMNIVIGTGDGNSCLWLSGLYGGEWDATLNLFGRTYITNTDGTRPGIRLGYCDENRFSFTNISAQPAVLVDHTEVAGGVRPNGNVFEMLLPGGGWVQNVGFNPITPNRVNFYCTSNSEPAPTLNGTRGLIWTTEDGVLHGIGTVEPQLSAGNDGPYSFDGTNGTTITIANNGTATPLGAANLFGGLVLIMDTVSGATGMFLVGRQGAVALVSSSATGVTGAFTATADTANRNNFYWNGTALTLQNKTGASAVYRVFSIRMNTAA